MLILFECLSPSRRRPRHKDTVSVWSTQRRVLARCVSLEVFAVVSSSGAASLSEWNHKHSWLNSVSSLYVSPLLLLLSDLLVLVLCTCPILLSVLHYIAVVPLVYEALCNSSLKLLKLCCNINKVALTFILLDFQIFKLWCCRFATCK